MVAARLSDRRPRFFSGACAAKKPFLLLMQKAGSVRLRLSSVWFSHVLQHDIPPPELLNKHARQPRIELLARLLFKH